MTKLMVPEEVNAISGELADKLISQLKQHGVAAVAKARNCGSHDKITFTFKGSLGSRRVGSAIQEFFSEKDYMPDENGHGTFYGRGHGAFDLIHRQTGNILQIIFYVNNNRMEGDVDLKFFSFN